MEGLSRRERRRLRKQMKKEEASQSQSREKMRKRLAYGAIPVIILVFISSWMLSSPAEGQGTPAISLEKTSHDFGQVSQAKGTVSVEIPVKNNGDGDLVVTSMTSSCMCTSASLTVGGQEGPRYGMHGIEGGGFSNKPIPPGGEGVLRIYYNPNVHASFRGAATRIITMDTNDPNSPKVSVRADLYQVD